MMALRIVYFVIAALSLHGSQVIPLPEVYLCPEILRVDRGEVIFNYSLTFYVHRLHPFEQRAAFGREGEGPGEFKNLIHLSIRHPHFLVYTIGKISFFTRQGRLVRELKLAGGRHLEPAGDGYVGYAMETAGRVLRISVNLYGSDGAKQAILLKKKHFFQLTRQMDLIQLALGRPQRAHYQVHNGNIFVAGEDDTIHVFDFEGRTRSILKLAYTKRSVGPKEKEKVLELLHSRFKSDRVRQLIRDNGYFPAHFPARRFVIDADRIYIPTFHRRGGTTRFVVMDLTGRILTTIDLPFSDLSYLTPSTYTIHQGKLYQFVDNEDLEHFEIHIRDIPE